MIKVITQTSDLNSFIKLHSSQVIGFVPTMGMLHLGHLELVKASKKESDLTIVSIFVNPKQFNNQKDFETYPKQTESDIELLNELGVDVVFIPEENQIYQNGYNYRVTENSNALGLCGESRPGHFDGVLTVLMKLFNIIKPQKVFMGLKDYQQYLLVKKMTEDFFMETQVYGVETVREESGLALSSRNVNLTSKGKDIADQYAKIFAEDIALDEIRKKLNKLDLEIDYLEERWGRKFIAVKIDGVRLIDNRPLNKGRGNTVIDGGEHLQSFKELEFFKLNEQKASLKNNKSVNAKKILFKMSGSIACYKACDAISKLIQLGYEIKIAATPDTFNFVGKATLEGLTGNPVISEVFESGNMMSHIHLNDWCDLVVLCPASANTLAKITLGISDNVVTSLSLSADVTKPYFVFPAMNARMLTAIPMQEAISKLKKMNRKIVFGHEGHLACGHVGQGRLAEPDEIVSAINTFDEKTKKINPLNILITAGGTTEAIDPVRFITNMSTGQTGAKIAETLSQYHHVTLLGSDRIQSYIQNNNIEYCSFSNFINLEDNLKTLLSKNNYDVLIHLAAVSDYTPNELLQGENSISLPSLEKFSSTGDFTITFKKNKKLISEVKEFSKNKDIKVVGFKLLRTDDSEQAHKDIQKVLNDADYVVANRLEDISDKKHIYEIYDKEGLLYHGENKSSMSQDLLKLLDSMELNYDVMS